MTTRVRPLAATDRTGWGRLWAGYLAFYGTDRPEAQFDLHFARLMAGDPRNFCARVAERDGALIGLAHYQFHPHGWQSEDICYLQDLYVDPDVRGTGAGRALIEAVYAAADAGGARGVYWTTAEDNLTARALYDRIGEQTPFIKYQRA